jgi:hypothetical protein
MALPADRESGVPLAVIFVSDLGIRHFLWQSRMQIGEPNILENAT